MIDVKFFIFVVFVCLKKNYRFFIYVNDCSSIVRFLSDTINHEIFSSFSKISFIKKTMPISRDEGGPGVENTHFYIFHIVFSRIMKLNIMESVFKSSLVLFAQTKLRYHTVSTRKQWNSYSCRLPFLFIMKAL